MNIWRWIVIFCFGLNCLLVLQLFSGDSGVFKYKDFKERKQAVQAEISLIEGHNRQLSREILLLKGDRETLDLAVRSEMHYLADGEIMYLFPRTQ